MPLPLTLLAFTLAAVVDAGTALAPDMPAPPAAKPAPALDVTRMPFTPDSITQVVHAHQTDIQDCYEKTLAVRQQKLQGKLMTHFVITPGGTVTGAQVQKKGTTLKDKDLNACVEGVLSGLHFPKPPDGKSHPVEYPFNLHAVD
jgi:hypothetical protein